MVCGVPKRHGSVKRWWRMYPRFIVEHEGGACMVERIIVKSFMAGAIFGLAIGGVVVMGGYMTVIDQYETTVLATPPWVEPQVCHIALIRAGDSGNECTPEGPVTVEVESPPDRLSKDAVYQGSMAVAGVAVFGSTGVLIIRHITKSAPLSFKLGNVMAGVGPYAFAAVHLTFAISVCCFDPMQHLPTVGILSALFAGVSLLGAIEILRHPPD